MPLAYLFAAAAGYGSAMLYRLAALPGVAKAAENFKCFASSSMATLGNMENGLNNLFNALVNTADATEHIVISGEEPNLQNKPVQPPGSAPIPMS